MFAGKTNSTIFKKRNPIKVSFLGYKWVTPTILKDHQMVTFITDSLCFCDNPLELNNTNAGCNLSMNSFQG